VFAESLSEYEISIPLRVNSAGEFVSHSLRHSVVASPASRRRNRRRRSFTSSSAAAVDYSVQVAGNHLHLALEPSYDLLGPGLVFEHRRAGGRNLTDVTRLSTNVNGRLCHFQGTIRGHSGSTVAVSTCNGLVKAILLLLLLLMLLLALLSDFGSTDSKPF